MADPRALHSAVSPGCADNGRQHVRPIYSPLTLRTDFEAKVELAIIAIHGNGGSGFRFQLVKPFIPRDVYFRPVTLPGFATFRPDAVLDSLRDYAACIRTLIAMGPRPRVLLGHGVGGSMVLEFVQHFPTLVDGIILHAPVGTRLRTRLFPKLMALPGARRGGQWLFSSRLARPLFKRLLFSRSVPNSFLDRFFDEYRQCDVFARMFEIITPEWFEALHSIDTPAALLWGERERLLAVEQIGDYCRLLPQSITRTIPAWDHFPMVEHPEEYAQEIVSVARRLVNT